MTKTRIINTKYLTTLGRTARGDAEAKVNNIIKLYSESKIPQLQTAENMIIDLLYNKNKKSVSKKYEKLVEKHKKNEPLNKILTQKKEIKNKAASKTIKLYKNTLNFKVVDKQQAFKNKLEQITVKPSMIGSAMASDLDALVARSYVTARRSISKNTYFKLYASLSGTGHDYRTETNFNIDITTATFSSKELNKFMIDFM
jgi:hypothetical protein